MAWFFANVYDNLVFSPGISYCPGIYPFPIAAFVTAGIPEHCNSVVALLIVYPDQIPFYSVDRLFFIIIQ